MFLRLSMLEEIVEDSFGHERDNKKVSEGLARGGGACYNNKNK